MFYTAPNNNDWHITDEFPSVGRKNRLERISGKMVFIPTKSLSQEKFTPLPRHYRKKYPVRIHNAYQSLDDLVFYIEK